MSDWISERCLHNVTGDGDYICGRFGETPSRCSSSTISMTLEYSFFFLLHSEPCPFLLAFSLFLFFIFMKSKMRFGPVSAEVALSATIYIRVSFACMGNNIHFFFLTLQVKIRADCVVDWLEVSRQSPKQKANKWNWMKTIAETCFTNVIHDFFVSIQIDQRLGARYGEENQHDESTF